MKKRTKKFFIIPGFHMKVSDRAYSWLISFLDGKGYGVVKVPIDWKYKTLSKNSEEFVNFFERNKGEENYVLGFSYGALIAFITANQTNPEKVFLCSMSPFFVEDRDWNKQWIKYVGKRRYDDSLRRSSVSIAKNLNVKSVIFCGELETEKYPALLRCCKVAAKLAKDSKLVMVENAPHQIDFPSYSAAIKREINSLR